MPWTETVPVGFNWSVSIIKSDIYLCWNPTYVTNWAAVSRMSFLSLRLPKQICHQCQNDGRSLLATFQSTGPSQPVVTWVQQVAGEPEKKVIFHIKCELHPWVWYQHRAGLCQCLYLVCKAGKSNKPGALESIRDLNLHPGFGLLWAASEILLLSEQQTNWSQMREKWKRLKCYWGENVLKTECWVEVVLLRMQ